MVYFPPCSKPGTVLYVLPHRAVQVFLHITKVLAERRAEASAWEGGAVGSRSLR